MKCSLAASWVSYRDKVVSVHCESHSATATFDLWISTRKIPRAFRETVIKDLTLLNLNLNLIVDGPGSSSAFDIHIVPICVQSRLETVH